MGAKLTPERAEAYAALAVANVRREYPNAPQHVLASAGDAAGPPSALHPAFYGSFDWHSCVHMHWLLVRLLRLVPDLAGAADARGVLEEHLQPDRTAVEARYVTDHPTFERPYGWAWALRLAQEVALLENATHDAPQDTADARWSQALAPLAEAVATRYLAWLPRARYPVRYGVHSNSAFGLLLAHDYALTCGHDELGRVIATAARRWFAGDRDCPGSWEPSGEDFLSPALVEAALMQRVDPEGFAAWLAAFLPELARGEPAALLTPALVDDRDDYRLVHLDGLNLSRAWCMRAIGARLPSGDERRPVLLGAAEAHVEAALPHVGTGGYGGDHWLASFALLALTEGTAPAEGRTP